MKIKTTKEPFQFEAKRFNFPCVITSKCPECGEKNEQDLNDDYLSYPMINAEQGVGFYCDECDEEWDELIVIGITAKKA